MTREHPTEHAEQVAFMRLVHAHVGRHPALRNMTASANGGKRAMNTAVQLKRAGVSPGYPDIILDYPSQGYHGLRIELKSMTGYASREQKDWIERLRANGYRAEVCRGADAAWACLRDYLGIGG